MRRWVLPLLASTFLSISAHGQIPGTVYRISVLAQADRSFEIVRSVVLPELGELGFTDGANLRVDYHAGDPDRIRRLAQEIADQSPDLILATSAPAALAAQQATHTVPIVFFGGQDAVAQGLAESLSHPNGNVTGVVILSASLDAKRLQVLHEAVPGARRIAVLLSAKGPLRAESDREVHIAAAEVGVEVIVVQAAGPQDYAAAFAAMKASGAEALVIGANAGFFADADELIGRARAAGLPTICELAEMAEQGCLIGYGPDRVRLYRIVAGKVAQVLRGVSPGTIPVEEPAIFRFAVNLRSARWLGLSLPSDIVVRADEVIE